jgi:ElaA protein
MEISWKTCSFADLTPEELYEILRLRSEVFVVEQNCVFLDMDNKDQDSWHLMGKIDGRIVAYTRLLPPGLAYDEMSIGRVVTSPVYRRIGLGRPLMQESIQQVQQLFGEGTIRIGAQLYLKEFYGSLGFVSEGDIYMEDGIPHIEMILP